MTQIATVQRLVGSQRAQILVRRQSACGHRCQSCGGCGPESAAQVTAVADNPAGAQVGDTVRVESDSRAVLGRAAALYLVPFVLLFAGYLLTTGLLGLGETGGLLAGLGCMLVSFGGCWLLERRTRRERGVRLCIVEVLKPCSDM
jgi:sigma-E factor negative regulatory protein RseC